MKNIDLKLLAIVSELDRTRSVSATAENLSLSQSAVSMSLAKLRRHFNDPLFVRTSTGMEPTPHAVELILMLKSAEELLQNALGHHVVFDPVTSARQFTICSTDIALVTVVPKLLKKLRLAAPNVKLDVRSISDYTAKMLESGETDLAVGFCPPMGAGFCQQRLFQERFVCVVRPGHPRISNKLSPTQYSNEFHIAVATSGTGHSLLEETLVTQHLERKVGVTVPNFLGIGPRAGRAGTISQPSRNNWRNILCRPAAAKILETPFEIPPYFIAQYWHERYTHDPGLRWLRSLMTELFSSSKPGRGPGPEVPERGRVSSNTAPVPDAAPGKNGSRARLAQNLQRVNLTQGSQRHS
ncbi:MAG: LysR family transcriptional regulator [Acidobacteriota bacterium]